MPKHPRATLTYGLAGTIGVPASAPGCSRYCMDWLLSRDCTTVSDPMGHEPFAWAANYKLCLRSIDMARGFAFRNVSKNVALSMMEKNPGREEATHRDGRVSCRRRYSTVDSP